MFDLFYHRTLMLRVNSNSIDSSYVGEAVDRHNTLVFLKFMLYYAPNCVQILKLSRKKIRGLILKKNTEIFMK